MATPPRSRNARSPSQTHYPTTWYRYFDNQKVLELLKNPRVKISYFAGHVHATDNVTNVNSRMRRHGWTDYCVGGGGGWACDDAHTGVSQGFVTGEVSKRLCSPPRVAAASDVLRTCSRACPV